MKRVCTKVYSKAYSREYDKQIEKKEKVGVRLRWINSTNKPVLCSENMGVYMDALLRVQVGTLESTEGNESIKSIKIPWKSGFCNCSLAKELQETLATVKEIFKDKTIEDLTNSEIHSIYRSVEGMPYHEFYSKAYSVVFTAMSYVGQIRDTNRVEIMDGDMILTFVLNTVLWCINNLEAYREYKSILPCVVAGFERLNRGIKFIIE